MEAEGVSRRFISNMPWVTHSRSRADAVRLAGFLKSAAMRGHPGGLLVVVAGDKQYVRGIASLRVVDIVAINPRIPTWIFSCSIMFQVAGSLFEDVFYPMPLS